jgi:quercetin dioxygenase-like cupin family protein
MAEHTVRAGEGRTGERGERLLARGEQVALRVWEHEPGGEQSPEHANPYEYVAYLVEGAMRVRIDGEDPVELGAGDSYAVPANTPYSFEVLEAAKVVEAVAPADALAT